MTQTALPPQARVVIIGMGIAGASTLWHLAKKGVQDIIAIDKGPLYQTGGSTSHTSGLIMELSSTRLNTLSRVYGREFYQGLFKDGQPCYQMTGGLEFASDNERMQEYKRRRGLARSWGVDAELISPSEAREKLPFLNASAIKGAFYIPTAGIVDAISAVETMAREVQEMEAGHIYGETQVTGIDVENGRVTGVLTNRGYVKAETVVICAGVWGNLIGRMAGVTVPFYPVEHANMTLGPFSELRGERGLTWPITRDQGRGVYLVFRGLNLEVGYYGEKLPPILVTPDSIPPHDQVLAGRSCTERDFSMSETASFLAEAVMQARELLPFLPEDPVPGHVTNGLVAISVDEAPIIGESPEVRGLYFNLRDWVNEGPASGKITAELIVDGVTEWETFQVSPARFYAHQTTPGFVKDRVTENGTRVYSIIHPTEQYVSSRNIWTSPFYESEKHLGAFCFEVVGKERPHWYESNEALLDEYDIPRRTPGSWEARSYSPIIGAEHLHARKHVAIWDLSSFMIFDILGPGALDGIQRIIVAQVDVPVGKAVYTPVLDEKGGIKADLTVQRLGPDHFRVVTGAAVGMDNYEWFRAHLPSDGSVRFQDMTGKLGVIGLWGPHAKDVLRSITGSDLLTEDFRYLNFREISIGTVPVLALRVSFVGESGVELYVPWESGAEIWDKLLEAGRRYRLIPAGLGTYGSSMRLEKGYRLWGGEVDLNIEFNLVEAGLFRDRPTFGDRASKVKRPDFIGKSELLRVREEGVTRRLCCMILRDPSAVVLGSEPILDGEQTLGYVTGADYGYSVGQSIAYGYLPSEFAREGTELKIEYFGARLEATVVKEPLYDPENLKLKA